METLKIYHRCGCVGNNHQGQTLDEWKKEQERLEQEILLPPGVEDKPTKPPEQENDQSGEEPLLPPGVE